MLAVALPLVLLVAGSGTGGASEGGADEGTAGGVPISDIVADNRAGNASESGTGEGAPLGIGSGGTTDEQEGDCCDQDAQESAFHGLSVVRSTGLEHLTNSCARSNENGQWGFMALDAQRGRLFKISCTN